MLIDRSHKNWIVFTLLGFLILGGIYFWARLHADGAYFGATPVGLVYGILALVIMIFASLLGARKKIPAWRIGRGTTWMKAHIWLSVLLIPLVVFHSGFRMGGVFTQVIWWAFILVTVTGIVGLFLQQFLPKLMTTQTPLETIYDQIQHVTSQLLFEADTLVSGVCGVLGIEIIFPEGVKPTKIKEGPVLEGSDALKSAYLERVRPCIGISNKVSLNNNYFNALCVALPPTLHPVVLRLEEITEECRQFRLQRMLHAWLHGWLFVHVPLAMALLVLAIVHAVTAFYY